MNVLTFIKRHAALGSLIVLESIFISSFAVILMFFTCKCVFVLSRGKTKQQAEFQNLQLNERMVIYANKTKALIKSLVNRS